VVYFPFLLHVLVNNQSTNNDVSQSALFFFSCTASLFLCVCVCVCYFADLLNVLFKLLEINTWKPISFSPNILSMAKASIWPDVSIM